jgi:hypothetical protein
LMHYQTLENPNYKLLPFAAPLLLLPVLFPHCNPDFPARIPASSTAPCTAIARQFRDEYVGNCDGSWASKRASAREAQELHLRESGGKKH